MTKCILFLAFFFSVNQWLVGQITTENNLPEHPRLLLLKGEEQMLLKHFETDEVWQKIQENTLEGANRIIPLAPLQKVLVGRRLLETSREVVFRICMLSYAYRTSGIEKYAARAEKELLSVCSFPDWNPSHFLDVAEMTAAVSIGYDWLYNYLPLASKEIIRNAIRKNGLLPSLQPENNNWLQRHNNWNQVCNASMTLGALAVWEDDKKLSAQIINRSIGSVKLAMAAYAPHGAYPEGYGYWHYGTSYNVMLISALEKVFDSDFGLSKAEGFMQSPYFVISMIGQGNQPFNFGDSRGGLRLNTSLFWFAEKLKDPGLVRYELNQLLDPKNYNYQWNNRLLPTLFVWGIHLPMANLPVSEKNMFIGQGETPVCLMRSGRNDKEGIYLAIKGGKANSNTHNHLDAGSFVMDAMGLRWAMDFGPEKYEKIESQGVKLWDNTQNGQRWSIFRYNNFAHNVVSVDNQLFDVNGEAKFESWSEKPEFMFATLNTTGLYSGLKSAWRGVAIVNGKYVQVQDELQTGEKPVTIQWRMATAANVKIKGKVFELNQKGKTIRMEVVTNAPVVLKSWSTKPANSYESENPKTILVGYEINLPSNRAETLIVRLIPSKWEDQKFKTTPIDDWK
jgi:hypothetical protein